MLNRATAWELPNGCTDDKSRLSDADRVDMRDVSYSAPGITERWQLAVYRDTRSATAAFAELRAAQGCTGQEGPAADIALGNSGFAKNAFEGDTAIGSPGAGRHWVGTRVGNALVVLNRWDDHERRPDLRAPDQRSVQLIAGVLTELCVAGWRC